MIEFKCDKPKCRRKAYMEVYWKSDRCGKDNEPCPYACTRHWSYLCRFHYYIDRIKNFLFRWDNWYAEASECEEYEDEETT